MIQQDKIRNFSIIAHIDHGKSTLADRLLEKCGAVDARDMENQLLDNMELERERGITIKARAVGLSYKADDGEVYTLNLIDTPGHVDFNYEVSRSLAACEGALLVVDAAQGIEAQTLANTYLALDHNLEILPVINKIDLPAADPARVKTEIEDVIGLPARDAPEISAKNGIGIDAVLEAIVKNVPAPKGDMEKPLRALIFDSQYDAYRGVIVYMRIFDGEIRRDDDVLLMAAGARYRVVEVGHMRPIGFEPCDALAAGDVGYFTASIKNVADTQVGDTVTNAESPASEPLPGYKKAQPMVFSGVYAADGAKYPDLRDALEKLKLNDASLSFEPESSVALGFGFRCGFLGLLHMDVVQERLEREYNLDLITTAPSVIYRVTKTSGETVMVDNPLNYPDPAQIDQAEEPFVKASIICPPEYVGNIMDLCQDRRGDYKEMNYLDATRVELRYEMPLNEIIYDFFDALKSRSRGYASLDYEFQGYRKSELVKLDILLNGEIVDALSFIVHRDKA
ncbi:MAG: translation elongation factor 4, partial [Oscillospiraceae bacterium]|nr:translation elongation factor 4 [Oscillospiraceae bacterium]